MIALALALSLSAAPKDCGEDRACYEALARSCKPVKLTQGRTNVSTVWGRKNKLCVVEYEAHLADAPPEAAANPLLHLRCELATDDVVKWEQDAAAKGRSHYPSEKLKECKAPACEPAPALDGDCFLTQCLKDEWKIQCGAPEKACSLSAAVRKKIELAKVTGLPSARMNQIVCRWACDAKGEPECRP